MTDIERVLSMLSLGKAPSLAGVVCEMLNETVSCGIDRDPSDIPPVMSEGWSVRISGYTDEAGLGFVIAQCGSERLLRAYEVKGMKFVWAGRFMHPNREPGVSFAEFAPTLIGLIEGGK